MADAVAPAGVPQPLRSRRGVAGARTTVESIFSGLTKWLRRVGVSNDVKIPVLLTALVVVFVAAYYLQEILLPFTIAVLLAYLLRPVVVVLQFAFNYITTCCRHRSCLACHAKLAVWWNKFVSWVNCCKREPKGGKAAAASAAAGSSGASTPGSPAAANSGTVATAAGGGGKPSKTKEEEDEELAHSISCGRLVGVLFATLLLIGFLAVLVLIIADSVQSFQEQYWATFSKQFESSMGRFVAWIKENLHIDASSLMHLPESLAKELSSSATLMGIAKAIIAVVLTLLFMMFLLLDEGLDAASDAELEDDAPATGASGGGGDAAGKDGKKATPKPLAFGGGSGSGSGAGGATPSGVRHARDEDDDDEPVGVAVAVGGTPGAAGSGSLRNRRGGAASSSSSSSSSAASAAASGRSTPRSPYPWPEDTFNSDDEEECGIPGGSVGPGGRPLDARAQAKATARMWGKINTAVQRYILAKTLLSLAMGLSVYIVLGPILHVKLAHLFGVITFVLNYIPNVGAVIAALVPLPVILLDPALSPTAQALAILIPLLIHIIIGDFIEPLVLAPVLNLHAVVVLLALGFWYVVWGVGGAILAVPITSVVVIMLNETRHPYARFIVTVVERFRVDMWLLREGGTGKSTGFGGGGGGGGDDDDAGDDDGGAGGGAGSGGEMQDFTITCANPQVRSGGGGGGASGKGSVASQTPGAGGFAPPAGGGGGVATAAAPQSAAAAAAAGAHHDDAGEDSGAEDERTALISSTAAVPTGGAAAAAAAGGAAAAAADGGALRQRKNQ